MGTTLPRRARHFTSLCLHSATTALFDILPSGKGRSELNDVERKQLGELEQAGYVNLGGLGLDIEALARDVRETFDAEAASSAQPRYYVHYPFLAHPELEEVLRNGRVNRIVQAYLGPRATFDRALVYRIPATTSVRKLSGLWHHDWCGRRLKMFVLLHDVDESNRPTMFAAGSHRGVLRWQNVERSRYADEYVESRFEVVPLTGRAGDALLLDTNGLHRASYEKSGHSRDVAVFEYSDYWKSSILGPWKHEIGIRLERFPRAFDPSGTLVNPRRLAEGDGFLVYGDVEDQVFAGTAAVERREPAR